MLRLEALEDWLLRCAGWRILIVHFDIASCFVAHAANDRTAAGRLGLDAAAEYFVALIEIM